MCLSVLAPARAVQSRQIAVSHPSCSSQIREMQANADGSIDVYFAPSAPEGKATNWVPTDPRRAFELMFRLYGPTRELFDKTWKLPDVEEVGR